MADEWDYLARRAWRRDEWPEPYGAGYILRLALRDLVYRTLKRIGLVT